MSKIPDARRDEFRQTLQAVYEFVSSDEFINEANAARDASPEMLLDIGRLGARGYLESKVGPDLPSNVDVTFEHRSPGQFCLGFWSWKVCT